MGNSNKKPEDYDVVRSFKPQDWVRVEKKQDYQIWTNKAKMMQAQVYPIPTQLKPVDLDHYELRYNNSADIVKVYNLRFHEDSAFCAKSSESHVFVERIPYRLSDVSELSQLEALTVLKSAYSGFNTLTSFYGPVEPYPDLICFNEIGKTKVWVNSNLADNKVVKDRQQHPIASFANLNAVYVNKILDLVETKTQGSLSPKLKNKFRQTNPQTYFQALNLVDQYAVEQNLQIPPTIALRTPEPRNMSSQFSFPASSYNNRQMQSSSQQASQLTSQQSSQQSSQSQHLLQYSASSVHMNGRPNYKFTYQQGELREYLSPIMSSHNLGGYQNGGNLGTASISRVNSKVGSGTLISAGPEHYSPTVKSRTSVLLNHGNFPPPKPYAPVPYFIQGPYQLVRPTPLQQNNIQPVVSSQARPLPMSPQQITLAQPHKLLSQFPQGPVILTQSPSKPQGTIPQSQPSSSSCVQTPQVRTQRSTVQMQTQVKVVENVQQLNVQQKQVQKQQKQDALQVLETTFGSAHRQQQQTQENQEVQIEQSGDAEAFLSSSQQKLAQAYKDQNDIADSEESQNDDDDYRNNEKNYNDDEDDYPNNTHNHENDEYHNNEKDEEDDYNQQQNQQFEPQPQPQPQQQNKYQQYKYQYKYKQYQEQIKNNKKQPEQPSSSQLSHRQINKNKNNLGIDYNVKTQQKQSKTDIKRINTVEITMLERKESGDFKQDQSVVKNYQVEEFQSHFNGLPTPPKLSTGHQSQSRHPILPMQGLPETVTLASLGSFNTDVRVPVPIPEIIVNNIDSYNNSTVISNTVFPTTINSNIFQNMIPTSNSIINNTITINSSLPAFPTQPQSTNPYSPIPQQSSIVTSIQAQINKIPTQPSQYSYQQQQQAAPQDQQGRIPDNARYEDIEQYIRNKYKDYIGSDEENTPVGSNSNVHQVDDIYMVSYVESKYQQISGYPEAGGTFSHYGTDYLARDTDKQRDSIQNCSYQQNKPQIVASYQYMRIGQMLTQVQKPEKSNQLQKIKLTNKQSIKIGNQDDLLDVKNMQRSLDKKYSTTKVNQIVDLKIDNKEEDNVQNQFDVKKLEEHLIRFQESRVGNGVNAINGVNAVGGVGSALHELRFETSQVQKIQSIDQILAHRRSSNTNKPLYDSKQAINQLSFKKQQTSYKPREQPLYQVSQPSTKTRHSKLSKQLFDIDQKFNKYVKASGMPSKQPVTNSKISKSKYESAYGYNSAYNGNGGSGRASGSSGYGFGYGGVATGAFGVSSTNGFGSNNGFGYNKYDIENSRMATGHFGDVDFKAERKEESRNSKTLKGNSGIGSKGPTYEDLRKYMWS